MMVTFNVGDVVRLKSGGPMMTITGTLYGNYVCTWFVDGKESSTNLPAESLYSKAEIDAQEAAYLASIDAALS
ncbi:YodC family protein [Aeromonas veronii]|uniref:YodC family protein n=1 Tax=Aeromonas veronii TaxID=654 RepID=UPI002B46C99A|nr:DUF2158 domain-containing protein [Aeromonas veronii]